MAESVQIINYYYIPLRRPLYACVPWHLHVFHDTSQELVEAPINTLKNQMSCYGWFHKICP